MHSHDITVSNTIMSGNGVTLATARAYVAGNVSQDGADVNTAGTEPEPFPAPELRTRPALQAACSVLAGAGVRPLDAGDQQRRR